ncbi:glycosyl transferase family 1 [Micromonospora ureilytica]|uniref:Glycosyltransferase involved in cell wall biosynthesis n=1 Tax=Micromonospora ureilytica TaxID=709868 RepID=A0ABS0JK60_9ACTN|nr:glycosyl transferase family 1 [Micromonospora ureilytica]MBG6066698.1 glycosyltransferase involved in cell wall biosynthesis [Micromonospora ureilytica]
MPSVEEYPRVLVVSAAVFDRTTGTGITLSNLFAGWPPDRLAQLYTEDASPGAEVRGTFARFAPRNAPVEYHLFRLRQRTRRPDPAGVPAAEAVDPLPGPVRARLRAQLRAFVDLSPVRVPVDVRGWLREQRPDVVYATLGSIRMMRLAVTAAQECDAPLVPHFMDDWPSTLYANGQVLGVPRLAVLAGMREVMRHSSYGMGISEAMAREFEQRYGLPFAAFGNCVSPSDFADPDQPASPLSADGTVDLVYVGGLHLDRWRSLRRIGEVVQRLAQRGTPARLTVHAPATNLAQYDGVFAGLPAVRLGRSLSAGEVPGVLRQADVLVHVEAFAEEFRRYTRYSLSTKIPQYLAAGRPVLGFGPAELASMAHLSAADAGRVVGVDDEAALTEAIGALCADAELRDRLGRQGLTYAVRHHRTDRVAARFAEVLREAAHRRVARPPAPRSGSGTTLRGVDAG